jgi:hypothetical protein
MIKVEQMPITVPDGANPLHKRLATRCEVMEAAGYRLQTMTTVGESLLLAFLKAD